MPLLRLAVHVAPQLAVIPNKIADEGFKFASDARRFESNPLTSPLMPIRLATADAMMRGCETLEPRLPSIAAPFVVVHGRDDRVIPLALSRALAASAASVDKQLVEVDRCTHCVDLEEPSVRDKVFADIGQWLVNHAKK